MHLPETEKALDKHLAGLIPVVGLVTFVAVIMGVVALSHRYDPTVASHLWSGPSATNPGFQFRWPPSFGRGTGQQHSQGQLNRKAAPLKAADHVNDGKHHLLLAATGSVATIKLPNILHALAKHDNLSIRLLLSQSACSFLQGQSPEQPALHSLARLKNVAAIHLDSDEWRKPWVRGDPILHIELRRWADLLVIAPLSANSLAKLAAGLSDNLLGSVVRAWDAHGGIDAARPGVPLPYGGGRRKGIVVAPAMNTAMWRHPVTAEHLRRVGGEWGVENGGWFEVLGPVEKGMACGDTGAGGMQEWGMIVETIERRLQLDRDAGGKDG